MRSLPDSRPPCCCPCCCFHPAASVSSSPPHRRLIVLARAPDSEDTTEHVPVSGTHLLSMSVSLTSYRVSAHSGLLCTLRTRRNVFRRAGHVCVSSSCSSSSPSHRQSHHPRTQALCACIERQRHDRSRSREQDASAAVLSPSTPSHCTKPLAHMLRIAKTQQNAFWRAGRVHCLCRHRLTTVSAHSSLSQRRLSTLKPIAHTPDNEDATERVPASGMRLLLV